MLCSYYHSRLHSALYHTGSFVLSEIGISLDATQDVQYTVSAMAQEIRKIALDCLLELDRKQQSIASVVNKALRRETPSSVDAALLTEIVYGVLRWRGRLDWILSRLVERPPETRIQYILRLGLYQLLMMDKIPAHAAIYETVELCHKRQKRFVNAVLRSAQRKQTEFEYPSDPVACSAIVYSYPEWLIKRWFDEHGLEWTQRFCEASNQKAPLEIRINSLRTTPEALRSSLHAHDCESEPLQYTREGLKLTRSSPIFTLEAFEQGWFFVQDEAAMLVTEVLDPQPDETIVDVCAAPGGKTTHIAQRMRNTGVIHAVDQSPARIKMLDANCSRLGITNVHPRITDAQKAVPEFRTVADRVLVDVPCSGFGTLRRHPDIRWKRQEAQIEKLARLQLAILEASAGYVKPGGTLVYSTCTTEPEENEQIVDAFLEKHPAFRVVSPGLSSELRTDREFIQTLPHRHGMDGFFIAKLLRQ